MRLLDSRPKRHVIGPARLSAAILVLILLGPGLIGASQATFWSSTRESNVAMILRRMNATLIGVNNTQKGQKINEKLTDAKFMPSREMLYRLNASSTGIADLKYKIASSSYDFVPGIYPAAIEGEERYAGKYYIERRLYTRSDYIRRNETEEGDDWIPCCSAGIDGESSYPSGLQKSTEEVFDCSCFQPPVT